MIVDNSGNVKRGFPEYAGTESYHVRYSGYSGEPVYREGDDFGEESLGYDLPPSHLFSAWKKAEGECSYCGRTGVHMVSDHIVPYAKGGAHLRREFSRVDNTAPSCDACNIKKGAQLGWKTLDGRSGFYWDGTPGDSHTPPPMPLRAKKRR